MSQQRRTDLRVLLRRRQIVKLKNEIINKEPKHIEKISDEARHLLKGLLNKNPKKRFTCDQI